MVVAGVPFTTVVQSVRLPSRQAAPIPTPKQQHIHSGMAMIRTQIKMMKPITPPTIAPRLVLPNTNEIESCTMFLFFKSNIIITTCYVM